MGRPAGRPPRKKTITRPQGGRSTKKINWKRVDELLMAGCTGVEIAAVFDMHPHTFYDRVLKEKTVCFTDYQSEKRFVGDTLIKEAQFLKAIGKAEIGDNTMLVWLGKNRLGQVDRQPEERATETLGLIHAMISKIAGEDAPADK